MWQEMEKSNPDLEMLKKSMRMSFPYRKHEYQRTADVFSMLEVFPVLRDFRFVSDTQANKWQFGIDFCSEWNLGNYF